MQLLFSHLVKLVLLVVAVSDDAGNSSSVFVFLILVITRVVFFLNILPLLLVDFFGSGDGIFQVNWDFVLLVVAIGIGVAVLPIIVVLVI